MMKSVGLQTALLAASVALRTASPVGAAAAVVLAAGVCATAALGAARKAEALAFRSALAQAAPPAQVPGSVLAHAAGNVAGFYGALGDVRYCEQQVRTLFGLAEKAGLVLSEGEYRRGYDKSGRFHTYQVTLPVQGPYGAVWQFAMLSLSSIPFASLDEISFRRNAVGDAAVEARVQLTIYLADGEAG